MRAIVCFGLMVAMALSGIGAFGEPVGTSEQLKYHNLLLVTDLGVGLWAQPFPVDYDGDGDSDLLVATADVPSNGVYFFENPGGDKVNDPVFRPGIRLGSAQHNMQISYSGDTWQILTPEKRHPDFNNQTVAKGEAIKYKPTFHCGRDNQWKLCDYDGDGVTDLVIGASDWREYGWDNAYDANGQWTRGPLHAYVYFVKNTGSNEKPKYADAVQVQAGGKPIDVYGCPSPNFTDFDGDGDLDLVCGEFLDKMTYFKNTGSKTAPVYAEGKYLTYRDKPIAMDLEMIQVVAYDWDKDEDIDLIVGQEDGRVALLENATWKRGDDPSFLPPKFFQQEADAVKVGALSSPCSVDWDADGDEDLIVGDTAGYLSFVENIDGENPPQWAAPVHLRANFEVIRIQAGPNGSIQGPAEAKWGYTVPCVADWNGDGLLDIVINSIWGEILWYENAGTATAPELKAAQPIEVAWDGPAPKPAWIWWTPKGNQLVTQWRTTPFVIDWNGDGLNDLVMLDTEGYLAFFERKKDGSALTLLPGKRVFFDDKNQPLRINPGVAGKSGRSKFVIADWDGDGLRDILIDSKSVDLLHNIVEQDGHYQFKNEGPLDARRLAGHSSCPTVVDWDRNKIPDLLTGAEDGFFYYLKNPRK